MADRNLPRIIVKRFAVVAWVMGWDITGPRWTMVDGRNVSKFPHYSLQKYGRANRYEINATINTTGGETVIRGAISGEEMLEWLDGILEGVGRFQPDLIREAWSRANSSVDSKAA